MSVGAVILKEEVQKYGVQKLNTFSQKGGLMKMEKYVGKQLVNGQLFMLDLAYVLVSSVCFFFLEVFMMMIGQNLATLEALVCAIMLLRRYKFTLAPDQNITYDIALTLPMKNGMKVYVERR